MRKMEKTGKKIGVLLLTALMSFSLTACSFDLGSLFGSGEEEVPKPVIAEDGVSIQGQLMDGYYSKSRNFESNLIDNCFYVVQNGYYYPVCIGVMTFDEFPETYVNPDRQVFYDSSIEGMIPTVFDDCKLVYYSTTGLLDYIVWERFYDQGYTIGVWNIQQMISPRLYLHLEKNEECIYPDTAMQDIYNLATKTEDVMIDKLGDNTPATPDLLDGTIFSSENFVKDQLVDVAVYDGTYYHHYEMAASMHAFKAYELYASIEYNTLGLENFYEIEIPDYLETGYYFLNNGGMIRLVRGDSYSSETDFNEQVLFPEVDETAYDYDPDAYIAPMQYSTYEPLNYFVTNQEGCLGYLPQDEYGNYIYEATEEEEEKTIGKIKEATKREIELWFPKGEDCSIEVVSMTGETTGDIYVEIGDHQKKVAYNRLEGKYMFSSKGKGEKATLVISGLFSNYEVHIVGVQQYKNQDQEDGNASSETGSAE